MHFFFKNKASKKVHSSLFRKWIISYASVLIMPIIFCSFYYFHSYNILKERTLTNQHLVLQNFGEQVDSVIYDTINIGNHLKMNKYVTALAGNTSTINSAPALDRHYLRDYLMTLRTSNSLIDYISIYFPESEYIVTCSSLYRRDLIPYLENKSVNLSIEDWNHIIDELNQSSIVMYSSQNNNTITIAQSLKSDLSKQSSAILCVQINKKQLLTYLNNNILNQQSCSFALINSDNILMCTEDNSSLVESLPIDSIADYYNNTENPILFDTSTLHNGTSAIIDCFHTVISDIKLISITEKNIYREDLTHLLEILFVTLTICLFTGLIVITLYSKRDYKPVEQIVHYINGMTACHETENNEYQLIMKILTHNQNEIEYQHTLLKNSYFQKILTGEIAINQITDSVAEQLQLNLPGSNICLVLLSTQNYGNIISNDSSESESRQLLYFIIENVFSELLLPYFPDNYFIIRKQHTAVLINIPDTTDNPITLIEELTNQLCKFMCDSYHLTLHAGISGLQSKPEIADAFLQSEAALEYCNLFNNGQLSLYEQIPQNPKINSIPLFTGDYVINLVSSGNLPSITDYFRNINTELMKEKLSWADAKSCFHFFYQTTARLKLYCQSQYGTVPKCLDFIDNSFFNQSLPEALSQTCVAFTHASAAIQDIQNHLSVNRWGADICLFIENNYFDMNINLNSIAEHFHISSAYLSKKFKEQYQKSVIDYLYEIRIANAKKLMGETTLKVAEIAQITGFTDSNAFIRIFKRYTGTTPGRYMTEKSAGF